VSILLVFFNICRSLLDQVQDLISLSIRKPLSPRVSAYPLRLALPGPHQCDNIHFAGRHVRREEVVQKGVFGGKQQGYGVTLNYKGLLKSMYLGSHG
jgi:hypothetical protein